MTSGAEPLRQCTSGPDNSCQFTGLTEVHEHNGRYYCQAHAPLDAALRFAGDHLALFIVHQQANGITDFSGIVFPPHTMAYSFNGNVLAQRCTFADGTSVRVEGSIDMSDSTFLGLFGAQYAGWSLTARRAHFRGDVYFDCGNSMLLDFAESTVDGVFRLDGLLGHTELSLDGMTLAFAPTIKVNVAPPAMPQNSSLRRLNLLKTAFGPGSEARYRAIRNLFHANRDREQEGMFYCYEKRARRKGLPLRLPASWIPRSVSSCYDWLAGYGQSYERALLWFIGVQLGFGFLYSVMSDRFAWGGAFDSQIAAFTFAQLVKPFELLSARRADGWPYLGVYTGGSGWWTFATVSQSVLSLTLVALFLLALRWRFRRD